MGPPDGLIQEKYRNSVAQGKVNPCARENGSEGGTADLYYQQPLLLSSSDCDDDLRMQRNLEVWTRITPEEEYVKLIIYHGKVIGALLIGDTDLEEVCENLILNELDVRRYGMALLDPDIDIEDYFD